MTTINTFTVAPEQQQRALELLMEVATRISKTVPGFLSVKFHKSVDGTRVVGYAQYASIEAVQAGLANMQEQAENPLLAELREITSLDPRMYETCALIEVSAVSMLVFQHNFMLCALCIWLVIQPDTERAFL